MNNEKCPEDRSFSGHCVILQGQSKRMELMMELTVLMTEDSEAE